MGDFGKNIGDIFDKLGALFSSFGIKDFIDILIVTLIAYKIIKFLRESRALHVIKGIALLLVVYFFISILDMEASTYIFKMVMNNAIIIVIILFAPELRHALESMGRSRFSVLRILGFNRSNAAYIQNKLAMNEVCRACADMSRKKIGALIVLERDVTVNDIVSSGTEIDAKVTKELVGSLFFPNSPLHDGAIVIRDGRIIAAGCILPLTQSNYVSSDLGTRHRASIGMSEQCDAVVVVVSEETGLISIAHKGRLERNISEGELLGRLCDYFDPVDLKTKRFRKRGEKSADKKQ